MRCAMFATLLAQLPPGRTRTKQENLARALGEAWVVRVQYNRSPLWLVAGMPQAQELMKGGTPRHAIWTLAELQSFLEPCGSPITTLEEAAQLLASECPSDSRV
jgi:hypothetical protein